MQTNEQLKIATTSKGKITSLVFSSSIFISLTQLTSTRATGNTYPEMPYATDVGARITYHCLTWHFFSDVSKIKSTKCTQDKIWDINLEEFYMCHRMCFTNYS